MNGHKYGDKRFKELFNESSMQLLFRIIYQEADKKQFNSDLKYLADKYIKFYKPKKKEISNSETLIKFQNIFHTKNFPSATNIYSSENEITEVIQDFYQFFKLYDFEDHFFSDLQKDIDFGYKEQSKTDECMLNLNF